MHVFLLVMVLYPEAQKTAQAELDRVIGSARLPSLEDRPKLIYVNALLQEVYRWHPIQPLNGGHVNMREDEYRGFRIPKGSSLHSNNWYDLDVASKSLK
jgi:cytochrome P450